MEITKRVLVLIFTNGLGKNVSLTINDPAEGLEDATVSSVMDEIVAASALGEESIVANKLEAKYVIQQVDEVELEQEA
ncbi:MAG: DUF2922 domain-containing protein [Cellulosilyticum sp.]|nr:DUF2922 domain-containing protein [Cellulosilyticum sp.]MEE1071858.1 DUF2922 domain-containing protein [Cellulosilyticum sp.]